jgi:SRSO17 transposase
VNGLSDQAVAAQATLDVAAWRAGFDELFAQIAGRFAQAASRRRARAYLLGLLSRSERKNGWTIAELAGDATPDGMQRLLNFYSWSADDVRDDLRSYVAAELGDPAGVLIADETGFLKKGTKSAGVQRQYSGTAGRVENCQVGVFLAYAVPDGGRALIDRELYVPQSWADDRDRCRQAGIADAVGFAAKPELARQMIERAITAGMPFGWVAADEVYGQNTPLRDWLGEHHVSYVLAVPRSFPVTTAAGSNRADELATLVPAAGWQQISCGPGSKGPRFYDWALIATASPAHHLLVRRALTANGKGERELAYFTCHGPAGTTLAELVRVAGTRWAIEECRRPPRPTPAWITTRSAATTPGTGTPPCPCSRWPSFRSAHLKGGTSACGQLSRTPAQRDHDNDDLIRLTIGEIRRLLARAIEPSHPGAHDQRWSRWRRRHQARARRYHYQRRQQLHLRLRP